MRGRHYQNFETTWSGITIHIRYEQHWLGVDNLCMAHLDIESVAPKRAPLPITETGYLSHFTPPAHIEDVGGPVAFVTAWIEAEASMKKWKAADMVRRQGSLFDLL